MPIANFPDVAYRNPSLPVEERVEDLLSRMSLADKAGLCFHDMVLVGPGGTLLPDGNILGRPGTVAAIQQHRMNHFNVLGPVHNVREFAEWHNRVQKVAAETELGIPVTLSTDPRHSFTANEAASALAGAFSQWPESLGLAALREADEVERFADIARQEYLAAGFRVALHPQVDLATEPRWSRVGMTFGEDAELTSELVAAYIRGLHGEELNARSVATITKHFPGGGPQKDGEDPHFSYGREQVYPGGQFDYHLRPFIAAIAAGATQMMPYYGMPVGTDHEEVGFGFNRGIITGLLRETLGFNGIVCADWQLLTDGAYFDEPMPARAWGVEHLTPLERALKAVDAGVDQFGGESAPHLLVELVESGQLTEWRLDESARRLLAEKFRLGLFENPYVDVDHAVATVGRPDFVAAGERAQRAALVHLTNADTGFAAVPVRPGTRVYIEGMSAEAGARLGVVVASPDEADLAVLRLNAPFEHRAGRFEALFHAGSLEFPADERERIVRIAETVPTIIDVYLDRPAVMPEIATAAATLLVNFGASDDALVDVLLGHDVALGRLPFDLPSSMAAIEASHSDVPFDTANPVFRFGDGRAGTRVVARAARPQAGIVDSSGDAA